MTQTKRGRKPVYNDGLSKVQRHMQRRRAALRAMKDAPCQDCGGRFPPECMDWDHVRGDNGFTRGSVMSNMHRKWEFILAEIEKCDLICANCHRIRTCARVNVVT